MKSPRVPVHCGAATTLLLSAWRGTDIDDPCLGVGTASARADVSRAARWTR